MSVGERDREDPVFTERGPSYKKGIDVKGKDSGHIHCSSPWEKRDGEIIEISHKEVL